MQDLQADSLEQKIDELIRLCDQLNDENKLLKSKESTWLGERAKLIDKNEQARVKVEAMISRLKALEQH